jgi:hypothetical protein
MSDIGSVILLILALAVPVLLPWVGGRFDRKRIREHVEAHGGKVIDILRHWFGGVGSRYLSAYDVTYMTRHGKRVTATCVTSMTSGVQWVSDRPPGSVMEHSEETEAAESIGCLQCGAKIPAGRTRCPHCGWSYAGAAGEK